MPIVFYGIAFIALASSLRINKNEGFLDKDSSNVIKGFFILLIVFSHILNSFPYNGAFASLLSGFRGILGQLLVSMFFFISGYGITLSVEKKGDVYAKSIGTNRLLRIIIYSIFSLIPFYIYSLCLEREVSFADFSLAIIGLKSLGNSSWFLFAILFCYFVSTVVFLFNYKNLFLPIIIITLGVFGYIIVMFLIGEPSWTWDTIISFPIGMFICYFRDFINSLLGRKTICYSIMGLSVLIVTLLQYLSIRFTEYFPEIVEMWLANFFFCLFFVSLTKVFVLKSVLLGYLGKISFAIFYMHQIVLCSFRDMRPIPNESLNYLVLFISVVVIGIPFHYIYQMIDEFFTNPIVQRNKALVVKDNSK